MDGQSNLKKGQRRKIELLKIAYRMFLEKGYENTSVDEIIEEAGIAKGTYYYYFKSKEQTLEEVIDMMIDAEEVKARAVMNAPLPIPQKVVGVVASFRPESEEMGFADELHRPENLIMHDKIQKKLLTRLIPILSDIVRAGNEEGIFNCEDIPERVKIIIVLANELFDSGEFTPKDIIVFIDTIEKILGAAPGTMSFITQLINN